MYQLPLSKTVWALADCDSFFASCEIAHDPKLRGKPVCVGKKGDIILAASYEAKRQGVTTGTPSREASKILGPQAIFVAPNFNLYAKTSKRIFQLLKQYTSLLQQYSIDEAYLDITQSNRKQSTASYKIYVQHIQSQIYKHTRIPVSFGVAPTKLLAKIFASLDKPYGLHVAIHTHDIEKSLKNLKLTQIPYIGKQQAKKLPRCDSILDFMETKQTTIKKKMGLHGLKIWHELHQTNCLQFRKNNHPQSISRRKSFHPNFTDSKELLWSKLISNIEKAYEEMIEKRCKTGLIKVSLRTKSFEKHKNKKRLEQTTDNKKYIIKIAKELFELSYQGKTMYRTTSIVLGNLIFQEYYSPDIFKQEQHDNTQKNITLITESINQKYGQKLVQSASAEKITRKKPSIVRKEIN